MQHLACQELVEVCIFLSFRFLFLFFSFFLFSRESRYIVCGQLHFLGEIGVNVSCILFYLKLVLLFLLCWWLTAGVEREEKITLMFSLIIYATLREVLQD